MSLLSVEAIPMHRDEWWRKCRFHLLRRVFMRVASTSFWAKLLPTLAAVWARAQLVCEPRGMRTVKTTAKILKLRIPHVDSLIPPGI